MAHYKKLCPNTKVLNAFLRTKAKAILQEARAQIKVWLQWARCTHEWEEYESESYDGHRTDYSQEWRCTKCKFNTEV